MASTDISFFFCKMRMKILVYFSRTLERTANTFKRYKMLYISIQVCVMLQLNANRTPLILYPWSFLTSFLLPILAITWDRSTHVGYHGAIGLIQTNLLTC